MSFTFLMGAPERATTGVLDRGLPAAKSVDQVRKKHALNTEPALDNLLLFEALSSCFSESETSLFLC